MKPLFWDRLLVPPTDKKTVWSKIDEVKLKNLDDFVEAFQMKREKSKKTASPNEKVEKSGPKILDFDRIRNIAIISKNLPITKVENALYNFSFECNIGVDDLTKLEANAATDEEKKKLDEVTSEDLIKLQASEKWLLGLVKINFLEERIFCMKTRANFDEAIEEISNNLKKVQLVCEFFTKNEDLKKLLSIILTFGNYMNGGNANKGQADGFGLKVLAKLKDVKSNNPKVTLLHFIVDNYMEMGGKHFDILSKIDACKEYDFKKATDEITALKAKLKSKLSSLLEPP